MAQCQARELISHALVAICLVTQWSVLRTARMLMNHTYVMSFCQKSLGYSRGFCGSLFISQKVKNVFPPCLVAKDKYCLLTNCQSVGMWILMAHC